MTKKVVSGQGQSGKTLGLSSNKPMVELFKSFCNWFDGQTELYIVILQEKRWAFVENDLYPIKWLKKS